MKKLMIITVVGLLSTSAMAKVPAFEKVDKDGNGSISKAEFAKSRKKKSAAELEPIFAAKDLNKDGVLNAEEYKVNPKKLGKKTKKKTSAE